MKICNKQDCNNPVFGKGYCKWHQSLREDKQHGSNSRARSNDNTKSSTYDSEKKKSALKRSSGIKPISDKQAKRLREYRVVRDKYLKENPNCEICGSTPVENHHRRPRAYYLCDVSIFMSVCRTCHEKIEREDKWARDNGYKLDHL